MTIEFMGFDKLLEIFCARVLILYFQNMKNDMIQIVAMIVIAW
jgi:hypothetical protein